MRTRGVKVLDPVALTKQLDWLVVPVMYCRDRESERRVEASHFRKPHEPWGAEGSYVQPVEIRRSRRRVLFLQHSGVQ